MFGFYATGLLHILGNATQAVTGAWRILLDTGMFANFPGFLYAKSGGRQQDLNFRIPPGGGAAVDLAGAEDIRKTIMALPYKDPGANTMALVDNIASTAQRVGGTANMIEQDKVRQNMPVGTTMAIVEQAAQTIGAVHERNYMSQSHEFQSMLDLLREDPDALWRYIKDDGVWTYEELVQTLNTYALVPVADPNTPTHIHRIMKMTTLKQLADASPDQYDMRKVDAAILRALKFSDPDEFFAPPAPPMAMPPDPAIIVAQTVKETKLADIQSRQQIEGLKAQLAHAKGQSEARIKELELQLKEAIAQRADEVKLADIENRAETADKDRLSREAIEAARLSHESTKLAETSRAGHTQLEHTSFEADLQREHDLALAELEREEAEKDRVHAIALEKAKPKPKPAGKK
jgi:hypothetical protein